MDLQKVITKNDVTLSALEEKLIDEINETYNAAIKAAIAEFKKLENTSEDKKVSSEEVQRILDKTMMAFSKRFSKLTAPIRAAMLECYEQGLKETAQVIAQTDYERTKE